MLLEHSWELTWRESVPDAVPVSSLNSQQWKVQGTLGKLVLGYFSAGGKSRQRTPLECALKVLFFISEGDGSCCMEHELSTIFEKKSPHSTWYTSTFLLSCFPISFWQLPWLHKLHLIFSGPLGKRLSVCHFWGLLACLPAASGRLSASLRHLWGWAVAIGSLLALPLCLPALLTLLPVMQI